MKNQIPQGPNPELIENISKYFDLRSGASLSATTPVPLQNSLTNLDKRRSLEATATKFNRKLVEVIKGDSQSQKAKLQFYQSIQELFEEFVV